MSRLEKTIKNAKIGVLFHVVFVFVQFFSRKIFLDGLGDTFIGTTATLQSFLGFLNLAELGIGTAIGFTLYKPIFEKNYTEINHIITFVGNLYKKIGLFIIGAALLLSAFFPLIFESSTIPLGVIYYAFFTFLLSSLLGYFFNYHLFLLQADQKDYVVVKYLQSFTIIKIILQAVFVYFLESFMIWITLELLTGILYTYMIRKKIQKEYPWLHVSLRRNMVNTKFNSYPELLKKIKQISVHKLGTFVSGGTDNILIFYFINAQSVAFFGNYQLVILNIGILVEKLFAGTKASVGNLVAENNDSSIHQVLWELMALRFFIGGVTVTCITLLIDPFISIWLGDKYILDSTVVLLFCLIFFIRQIVQPIESFKQAYGLYGDTWAPIAEGILNLMISIVFAQKYGLAGILMGTNISIFLIVLVWRPIYVYRYGFKKPIFSFIIGFSKLMLLTFTCFIGLKYLFTYYIHLEINSLFDFAISCLIVASITIFIFLAVMYPMSSYFRHVIARVKNQLIK